MEIQIHRRNADPGLSKTQLVSLCQRISSEIRLQAVSCTVIFVDDPTLQKMHAEYLNDPEPTDVITFDLGDEAVEGEIYISVDRAREQAAFYQVSLQQEISRLIIHGLLHLKGYDDREEPDRLKMKNIEDRLVGMLSF